MNRFGVCEYLKIEENLLVNWLTLIESNYRQTNPYHNSTHAGDVLHASAFFLSTDKISVSIEMRKTKEANKPTKFKDFLMKNCIMGLIRIYSTRQIKSHRCSPRLFMISIILVEPTHSYAIRIMI